MTPNLTRQYAHEVVTAAMHNEVCYLSVAQRARDQAEIMREQRDDLLAALRDLAAWANLQPDDPRWDNLGGRIAAAIAKAQS